MNHFLQEVRAVGASLLLIVFVSIAPAESAGTPQSASPYLKNGETKRLVFSPWSSKESKAHYHSVVIRHIEVILNHLGVRVIYADLDTEDLPDPKSKAFKDKYLGVISFFDGEEIKEKEKWMTWLEDYSTTGMPWVQLGYFGFLGGKIPADRLRKFFEKWGVKYTNQDTHPYSVKVAIKDPELMEFERKLGNDLVEFPPLLAGKRYGSPVKHGLKLQVTGFPHASSAVFNSPRISVAYGRYGLTSEVDKDRRQWQVNPFKFLQRGFNIDVAAPMPDVNVINGRRVYYSHIDGDAIHSISHIKDKDGYDRYCGEIMDEQVFRKYSDLPFGVSIIVSEVHPRYHGNKRLMEMARGVLKGENIEVASHTFSHPLFWVKGKSAYPIRGKKFDEKFETVTSMEWIRDNLAGGKPIEVLYWSGDCMPKKVALEHLEKAGYLNMNGGDSLFDNDFPSLAWVSPLGRPMGENYQVFASNSNDNIYTDGWEGPFFGFRKVVQTFERTGTPIILKPINVYFHFFSAERRVGVEAVQIPIDWALKQEISPIFPSDYVKSVLGWKDAKVVRKNSNHFVISGAKRLFTLRIDEPRDRVVDLAKSKGILGFRKLNGSLYLHLDQGTGGSYEVFLSKRSPQTPFVEHVGGILSEVRTEAKKLALQVAAFTRPPLVINGIPKRLWGKKLQVRTPEGSKDFKVDKGVLKVEFLTKVKPQKLEVLF